MVARTQPAHFTHERVVDILDHAPDSGGYKSVTFHLLMGDTLRMNQPTRMFFRGPILVDVVRMPDGRVVVETR